MYRSLNCSCFKRWPVPRGCRAKKIATRKGAKQRVKCFKQMPHLTLCTSWASILSMFHTPRQAALRESVSVAAKTKCRQLAPECWCCPVFLGRSSRRRFSGFPRTLSGSGSVPGTTQTLRALGPKASATVFFLQDSRHGFRCRRHSRISHHLTPFASQDGSEAQEAVEKSGEKSQEAEKEAPSAHVWQMRSQGMLEGLGEPGNNKFAKCVNPRAGCQGGYQGGVQRGGQGGCQGGVQGGDQGGCQGGGFRAHAQYDLSRIIVLHM